MIWLRAIGVNLKAAFVNLLEAVLMTVLMAVVLGLVGGILFAIGWVINFFFGPIGVLVAMGFALGAFLVWGIVEFVQDCYRKVKETKERLEILDRYR